MTKARQLANAAEVLRIAAKMLKIATRINDFWAVQCDEIKQIFLDLTARRYTEIANKHK